MSAFDRDLPVTGHAVEQDSGNSRPRRRYDRLMAYKSQNIPASIRCQIKSGRDSLISPHLGMIRTVAAVEPLGSPPACINAVHHPPALIPIVDHAKQQALALP